MQIKRNTRRSCNVDEPEKPESLSRSGFDIVNFGVLGKCGTLCVPDLPKLLILVSTGRNTKNKKLNSIKISFGFFLLRKSDADESDLTNLEV